LILLDVNTLDHVRRTQKKDVFFHKKLHVKNEHSYEMLQKIFTPFYRVYTFVFKKIQLSFRRLVRMVEKRAMDTNEIDLKNLSKEERAQMRETAKSLVRQAHQDMEQEDYSTAEKKYLAAIKQDPRSIDAYKGLAHVYRAQGQIDEAIETYNFVLHIQKDEEVYVHLGEIYEEKGQDEKAVEYFQEAVLLNPDNPTRFAKIFDLLFYMEYYETALEAIRQALSIEPQNPKYLDNFIETSILLGQKDFAEEGYKKLRMINPENQKLQTFRQRIDEMK